MSLYSKSTFSRLQYLEKTVEEYYKALNNSKSELLDEDLNKRLCQLNKEYDVLRVKGDIR